MKKLSNCNNLDEYLVFVGRVINGGFPKELDKLTSDSKAEVIARYGQPHEFPCLTVAQWCPPDNDFADVGFLSGRWEFGSEIVTTIFTPYL